MTRRWMTRLATATAVGLLSATAPQAETFTFAFQGDVQALDPHVLNETFTLGFLGNVYEGLTAYGPDLSLEPGLAVSWENPEPTKWIFRLREGVTFQDGSAFTADDVIFSWQRAGGELSDMKNYAEKASNIVKIDDYTIEVTTPAPNPILPREWVFFYIMDKEWSEANNATQVTDIAGSNEGNFAALNANGTGPFQITEREPGVSSTFVRYEGHWNSDIPTNVTRVEFTPIPQDATRTAALRAGELDLAYPIPVQDWQSLADADGVSPLTGAEARTIFLGLDQGRDELLHSNVTGSNPFKDIRVREAFARTIDLTEIRDTVMRGASAPSGLMIAPQINGYNAALNTPYQPDLDRARALMEEAGYADGFEVTMDCPNDRYVNDEAICEMVVQQLARINVTVDLLAQTKSRYFAKVLAQNGYDTSFYLLGWTPGTMDAHNVLLNIMSCQGEGSGLFNLGNYCNQRVTELTALVEQETDQAKRQAMIDEAFKITQEEFGYIPLHQQPLSWGIRDGVTAVQRADNVLDFRYVVMP